jgi:hypothetical protein
MPEQSESVSIAISAATDRLRAHGGEIVTLPF